MASADAPGAAHDAPAVTVLADPAAVVAAVAKELACRAAATIEARGRFSLALAGGSTPRALYSLLASHPWRGRIDWRRVELFWGDERPVGPGHEESNFRMVRDTLLAGVDVDSRRIHRIEGERDPEAAARAYQELLRDRLGEGGDGGPPALDLVLLGMGPDGHTASLFPGSDALEEEERWVVALHHPADRAGRITMTRPLLERARHRILLVTGSGKAAAVRRALTPGGGDPELPVRRLRPRRGTTGWYLDEAAAAHLSGHRKGTP